MNISLSELSTGTGFFTETYTYTTASVAGVIQYNESYVVTLSSGPAYRVEITYVQSQTTVQASSWVLKNGTAINTDYNGRNTTGGEANSLFQGLMYPFSFEADYGMLVGAMTGAGATSGSGTTVQIGDLSATVTQYSSSSFPLNFHLCGTYLSLSSFSMSTASFSGSQVPLLSRLSIAGTATYAGQQNQILSFVFALQSATAT